MADGTRIQWARHPVTGRGATWNPIVGCSVVTPGCKHCYAMRDAYRKGFNPNTPHYHGLVDKVNGNPVWNGAVARASADIIRRPAHWREGRGIFVNSMGDLFHEAIPVDWIDEAFGVMREAHQHFYFVLTKRGDVMHDYLRRVWAARKDNGAPAIDGIGLSGPYTLGPWKHWDEASYRGWPMPHVSLGVSIERQEEADLRRPALAEIAAAGWTTFVSYEPALGPIDWRGFEFVDCIISGGESGPGARPHHPDWHRATRDFCRAHGIRYHFKQWGAFHPSAEHDHRGCLATPEAVHVSGDREFRPGEQFRLIASKADGWAGMCRIGTRRAGRSLDGRTHDDIPISRNLVAGDRPRGRAKGEPKDKHRSAAR